MTKNKLSKVRPGAIAFWMFNDASTTAEKIEYMRACRAGGIDALAMHSRSGNLVPYASRDWYAMIAGVVEEGRRLDMSLWLYDEDPFPSGAAGGMVMERRPELKARHMELHDCPAHLKPGDLWLIGEARVLWAGLRPLKSGLQARDLTGSVGLVRRDWFMTPWDSRYYYNLDVPVPCPRGDAVRQFHAMRVPVVPAGYALSAVSAPFAGIQGSWGALPDLLHPDAFACFRDLSLEPYRRTVGAHFGKTIPGIFTDEAKPHGGLPVTPGLWKGFELRFGFDLQPRLWQLFGETIDRSCEQVRLNYRRWINERFLKMFVRPYRKYCERLGMILTGHFSPEDDPLAEARTGISVMSIMRETNAPGTDLIVPRIGNDANPTLNLGSLRAASVRAQRAQNVCISESLGLSGWEVTTQTCRRILAWQKTLGINRFFLHGFFTSAEGVQNYEAPPELGPGSSVFAGIGVLNEWLKKLDELMDGSLETAPVALFNGMATFWSVSADRCSQRIEAARQSLWRTSLRLLQTHVGFHLADEPDLTKGRCVQDGLSIGACRYGCILIPAIEIIGQSALQKLALAVSSGVRVYWFGGGPKLCIGADEKLMECPALPGTVLRVASPSRDWCRRCLPLQADVKGVDAASLFVRRFRARDRSEYLLATNVEDREIAVSLADDGERSWRPLESDGLARRFGRGLRWRMPAGGCGLFRLDKNVAAAREKPPKIVVKSRPLAKTGLRFERVSPNLARLTAFDVKCPGRQALAVDFARPYWQLFDDYQADKTHPSFAGAIPVESRTPVSRLTYRANFEAGAGLSTPVTLVLDPRCARGSFDLSLNGCTLRKNLRFPLDRIAPTRLNLREIVPGANRLTLDFKLESAMDGLLSQLYLEGNFNVEIIRKRPRLSPPKPICGTPSGWQARGLPHYMGRGIYRWSERISEEDLAETYSWQLELDNVSDSAELFVNGVSAGRRAWPPWRWDLPSMRTGRNLFDLRVDGTAGNKHALIWPDQPQGWIGGGRLARVETR